MSRLSIVRNPFDPRTRDEHAIEIEQPTIEALVGEYLPASAADGTELVASINGHRVDREDWGTRIVQAGEHVVFAAHVRGGKGGILAAVLMIAVMVFAPQVALYMAQAMGVTTATTTAAFMGTSLGMAMTAGVAMLGSAIVSTIASPAQPKLPGRSSFDTSPSYAWQPVTTQEPGGPIMRVYGRTKLYGNIIAGSIESSGNSGEEQIAHMLIDLGLGPYSSLYDFEINDQPIANYRGVTVTTRLGHINQDFLPGFGDTSITRTIGTKVEYGTPVVRTTPGSDYDALQLVLTFPQGLFYSNDSGGLSEQTVNYRVELSADGGSTWFLPNGALSIPVYILSYMGFVNRTGWSLGFWAPYPSVWGSTTDKRWIEISSDAGSHTEGEPGSAYVAAHSATVHGTWRYLPASESVFPVASANNHQTATYAQTQAIRRTLNVTGLTRGTAYQVRVTNLSVDQTSSRYSDDLYLDSIVEILSDDFQYPRTVLAAVQALATEQISGGMRFGCMGEAAIIRVWNGSAWSSVWSNNPAWVCWDILTQPVLDNSLAVVRYDGYDPSRLDLTAFYAWAQWCDTLVPDGAGGTEARCMFDGGFDTFATAWESALEVANNARAVLLMRGTTVTVVYDHVHTTPAQLFTVGNTDEGSFSEAFLPLADRAQAIEASYVNSAEGYQRDTLLVIDPSVTEAAAQRTSLALRGVTRPSQIWRELMYRLKSNQLLTRTAELGADIDSIACTVGDMIWVQNDVTRWGEGGRITAGTLTTIDLDHPVTLESGKTYELKLRLADDTLLSRTITTAAGTVSTVTVSVAFPSVPTIYDPWAIGETGKAVKEFIVTDIRRDGDQRAQLSLIEYNASIHGMDEGTPAVPTENIAATGYPELSNLTIEEGMVMAGDGALYVHLDVRWDQVDTRRVIVFGGTLSAGLRNLGETEAGQLRISSVTSGETYRLQLCPITLLGTPAPRSAWLESSYTVVGDAALKLPLPNPTNLSANYVAGITRLYWDGITDSRSPIDWEARFGPSWASGTVYVRTSLRELPVAADGTWWISAHYRAPDGTDVYSAEPVSVVVAGAKLVGNVVATYDEYALGWPGSVSDGAVVFDGDLRLMGAGNVLDSTDFLAELDVLWMGGVATTGTYTIPAGHRVDVGRVDACSVTMPYSVRGQSIYDNVLAITDFLAVTDLLGASLGPVVAATPQIRLAQADGVWGDWKNFMPGEYVGRHFDGRLVLTSSDPQVFPIVDSFSFAVDVDDRIDTGTNVAVAGSGVSLLYADPFNGGADGATVPAVQILVLNAQEGDTVVLSAQTLSGFTVQIKNGGVGVARNINWTAKGY